jgi:copper homeostasis protein
MLLELAVFNEDSCRVAATCGVQRIELCENYPEGGLTPSADLFTSARSHYDGKIFVMLRPRPGDFVYTHFEEEVILAEADRFARLGADGFVSGFLTASGEINYRQTSRLVRTCAPLPVTFHRAFDVVQGWREAIDGLVEAGCKRILTSGGQPAAMEGRFRLAEMMDYASGRIIILPGGGVRSSNLREIMKTCGPAEIHSAAISVEAAESRVYVARQEEVENLLRIAGSAMDV